MAEIITEFSYFGIDRCELFATPESASVIHDWIEAHPKAERLAMYTVMGMTVNLLEKQLAQYIKDSDQP